MIKKLLLGVGNDIRGDDAVGELVAREFEKEGWKSVDCGSIPENYITTIDKGKYDTIVIVDAASMGIEPGDIRIVPRNNLGVFTMSTHALPLSLVMDFLEEKTKEVILIGIQPKEMKLKEGITEEIEKAKERLLGLLETGGWRDLPKLERD